MAKHLQNSVDQQPKASAAARLALKRRVQALGVGKKVAHANPQAAPAAAATTARNSATRNEGGKLAAEGGGDANAVSSSPQLQRWPEAEVHPSAWRSSMAHFLDGPCRKWRATVDVIERQLETASRCVADDVARHIRGKRLAAFVMADITLCAANAIGHGLLRDTEQFSDGFEVVH